MIGSLSLEQRIKYGIRETERVFYTRSGFGIQKGNSKMGWIASFSIEPVRTCMKGIPCERICYAVKVAKYSPQTKKIWQDNTDLVIAGLDAFVEELTELINLCGFDTFRWHVAGDFVNEDYFIALCKIADNCPNCNFFTFTKKYAMVANLGDYVPSNFNIILSAWGNFQPSEFLKDLYAVAYVADKAGKFPIPKDAFICAGDCSQCRKCVTARGGSIVFVQH